MPSDIELEAQVVSWLTSYSGNDQFLRSLRRWLETHDSLTEGQMRAAIRNYQEARTGLPSNASEAGMDDCTHIHNGVYTIDNGTEHLTFQIYTPLRGTLAGKRIIKRKLPSGRYQGFAFLTPTGGLKVWRRFAADDGTLYVSWARALLSMLFERNEEDRVRNPSSFTYTSGGVDYHVAMSTVCRRCNRRLTTPTSIRDGIGPECARRSVEETVAANAMAETEAVNVAATETIRAEQEALAERNARAARERRATAAVQVPFSQLDTGEVL